jgi:hypothetical protein
MRTSICIMALFAARTLAMLDRAHAATVWTGYATTFSKPDGADPLSPQWQDHITASVALTRVNYGGGFINPLIETAYDKPTSPAGTLWAFPYNNPGKEIAAVNWANLAFHSWATALGGNSAGGPPGTVGQPAVVHLVAEDIYLDFRLTSWTVRTGGGFSYRRAASPRPAPADFNADGLVDAADLAIWRNGFGTGVLPSEGDADADSDVDGADFLAWRQSLTVGPSSQLIPEPTSIAQTLIVALTACASRHRCV